MNPPVHPPSAASAAGDESISLLQFSIRPCTGSLLSPLLHRSSLLHLSSSSVFVGFIAQTNTRVPPQGPLSWSLQTQHNASTTSQGPNGWVNARRLHRCDPQAQASTRISREPHGRCDWRRQMSRRPQHKLFPYEYEQGGLFFCG